jgi:hypothetical protein
MRFQASRFAPALEEGKAGRLTYPEGKAGRLAYSLAGLIEVRLRFK